MHDQDKHYKKGALLVAVTAWLLLISFMLGTGTKADSVVHFFYFYDPACSVCEETHRDVLEPLIKAYGERIVVDERNISEMANFELMLKLEQQYQVMEGSIPEIFIGDDALIGGEEIRQRLQERIDHYLAQGGVALPTVAPAEPTVTSTAECKDCDEIHRAQRTAVASKSTPTKETAKPPIYIAFFYQPGCDICERSERDLQYIQGKYPQVRVERFNVQEEAALNQYLCIRAGVPEEIQLTAPIVFVGDAYLAGAQIRAGALEDLIQPYLNSGLPKSWANWEAEKEIAEKSIIERFRSFGLLTIIGAGLLDGINPCAFATMIFLISYLSIRKRKGRELLLTGAAFTTGVFLTYLGVGFGFLKFLTALPILDVIGKWVYGLTMLLCLGLAWGSLVDYRRAKEGRLEDMSLKLPDSLRDLTHRLIREGSRAQRFVLASLLLGLAVSLVELACTGQVYLPTIVFMLGIPQWRTQAALALLIYNVMFIIPLIGIFVLVYYGTTSQQMLRWMRRHAAAVKLGMAVLFTLLAIWLGYSLFALENGHAPATSPTARATTIQSAFTVTPAITATPFKTTPTASPSSTAAAEGPTQLTILYTADSNGFVAPCG